MVLKGQFLERPTLIPLAGGLVLEGVSHRGEQRPGLLVLPPPPVEGSGMDHVVGAELAFAVSRVGHPTLRFNYRGVGGSQGAVSRRPEEWLEDARAALELARDNAGGAAVVVAAIGASDAVALKLAELEPLAGVAIINPSIVRPAELREGFPLAVVLAERDETQDRGSWAAALEPLDGVLTIVAGATRTYQKGLPEVGKAVASLVGRAGARRPQAR
ncbi:MAG: alpha/beta hydrolase [Myxococcota bacterium]